MHHRLPTLTTPHAATTPLRARWFLALACAGAALASPSLQAQTVYRSVGPDGRITFSDKPPLTPATKASAATALAAPTAAGDVGLPYELRQVVGKFPVTLYTSDNCAPCDGGRRYLVSRGVPFTEKTIITPADAEALKALSGSTSLPFLTIGAQHVNGYSSSEWTSNLNAAGYPERSKLPASYRAPAATPLVMIDKTLPPPKAPAAVSAPAAPIAPIQGPGNPAGIQF
jgi:glutaredoxin